MKSEKLVAPSGRENTKLLQATVALAALSVCIAAAAEKSPPPTQDTAVSLEKCATTAFRNKNEAACNALEGSAKPQATGRSWNPSSVPTTSPNYRNSAEATLNRKRIAE